MLALAIKPGGFLALEWEGPGGRLEQGRIKFGQKSGKIRVYVDAPESLYVYRCEGVATNESEKSDNQKVWDRN